MNKDEVKKLFGNVIDLNKDLPSNVFINDDYEFWFFERPIVDYRDMMLGLFSTNFKYFNKTILMSFGNIATDSFDIYQFDNANEEEVYKEIEKSWIEYPTIISNINCDWLAFESAYEEIGVIGFNKKNIELTGFLEFLNENFIKSEDLVRMSNTPESGYFFEAKVFTENYFLNKI